MRVWWSSTPGQIGPRLDEVVKVYPLLNSPLECMRGAYVVIFRGWKLGMTCVAGDFHTIVTAE